ncbi:RtcB family protein [Sandaracinus amylolyticus]|uniref:3'-phosphate/5'-hydroxy nucleic acid ligase n=1 Tax=Sandaracinus amylolyticus TaxID=927083 RepID=A0A0F6WA03_9BACT|nr:RtcB family protein [Sandaracinus amylolyticus]AKF11146.1 RNA-2',3'-PO4 RNA-5'-OH ligase [Sandaracinus amylolyticus]
MTTTSDEPRFLTLETPGVPVKAWIDGVPIEKDAELQLRKTAMLPFVHSHLAVMPDVHVGVGATVGTVIPTKGAIVPAAVGVDIGCGMIATRTSLVASDLPDSLSNVRSAIEKAVPHGRADFTSGTKGLPSNNAKVWRDVLEPRWKTIAKKHPKIAKGSTAEQLGTLGGGNHFVEICLDESQRVWIVLHSGSRGVGNRTGKYFIEIARREMERLEVRLPDYDLAYLEEGTGHFEDYREAVGWAQDYAAWNRRLMMEATLRALKQSGEIAKNFTCDEDAVNCHHNYVAREEHFGAEVWVTRKGAVRAGLGELGIIPGSMGAKSFIVRGKGNPESFCSCSHGAGRKMSRSAAKRAFTVDDHRRATEGVECRKDDGVIDETPMAYKDIDAVMAAQSDLVEIVHTLKQVVCVKG